MSHHAVRIHIYCSKFGMYIFFRRRFQRQKTIETKPMKIIVRLCLQFLSLVFCVGRRWCYTGSVMVHDQDRLDTDYKRTQADKTNIKAPLRHSETVKRRYKCVDTWRGLNSFPLLTMPMYTSRLRGKYVNGRVVCNIKMRAADYSPSFIFMCICI